MDLMKFDIILFLIYIITIYKNIYCRKKMLTGGRNEKKYSKVIVKYHYNHCEIFTHSV